VATVDVEGPDAKPRGGAGSREGAHRGRGTATSLRTSSSAPRAQGLFLTVSWLAEEEICYPVPQRTRSKSILVLTSARIVLWLPLAILPGAVVICG
jgi:hypothetical protein